MSSPKPFSLTVAILTHNRLRFLRDAIDSVLNQTWQDFELLILDNHSTDGTAEYLVRQNDPRLRYVRNPPGMTPEFNYASAVRLARGARISLLHDDDMMEPELLSRQMAFMDVHAAQSVYVRGRIMNDRGEIMPDAPEAPQDDLLFAPGEYLRHFLAEHSWWLPSGSMFKLSPGFARHFLSAIYFQTRREATLPYPGCNDVLTPASANLDHPIGYIAAPLIRRRVHNEQITRAIDTERPLIFLYTKLKTLARKAPSPRIPEVCFDAYILRYAAQRVLTQTEGSTLKKRDQTRIFKRWEKIHATPAADARFFALPVTLLLRYLGALEKIPKPELPKNGEPPAMMKPFLAWAGMLDAASGPTAALRGRRVILFGSVFVAALLILDLRKHGISIVACVDSNRLRQGRRLLGVPIHPVDWLASEEAQADIILLTPEKSHESVMADAARQWLRTPVDILSWKELLPNESPD